MDQQHNRNFLMALVLSFAVLLLWNIFYGYPAIKEERAKKAEQPAAQSQQTGQPAAPSTAPRPEATTQVPSAGQGAATPEKLKPRAAVLAQSPRVAVDTPSLKGSIALKGGRIDDLVLRKYTNAIEPDSGNVVLFTPSSAEHAFYAEHGWSADPGARLKLPDLHSQWSPQGPSTLTPEQPVTLVWDNGEGLIFRRVISVDENYMFTVRQEVENQTGAPVTLYPYALVSRHDTPTGTSYLILHRGYTGVLGENGLKEVEYDSDHLIRDAKDDEDENTEFKNVEGGWLGFTDEYWAGVVIPDQKATYTAKYSIITTFGDERYQADYLQNAVTVAAGAKADVESRVFAGAKEVRLVDAYDENLNIDRFELLIDWGWLYFLTKPMFYALDYCYKLVGNFGLAILIVTILIKLILFPLANKSYVSMSRMKKMQPEMERIKKRFEGDMMRQQQAISEMYKKEKLNPAAGCWPVFIQIPVFFALYKVLFTTIEMRQAPFFGWIKDLSAPDPTSIWNLFGLLPFDPSVIIPSYMSFLEVGAWPLVMGLIMFVQMRLNPTPTDPTQAKLFTWMPVFFTFLLAQFPAGLVIYWTWNNLLSVLQQSYIMSRQGVEIALWENLGLKSKRAGERPET